MKTEDYYELDDTGERARIMQAAKHIDSFAYYLKITKNENAAIKALSIFGEQLSKVSAGKSDEAVEKALKETMLLLGPSERELEDFHSLRRADRYIASLGRDDIEVFTKAGILKKDIVVLNYMKNEKNLSAKEIAGYFNSTYKNYLARNKMTSFTANDIDQIVYRVKQT